MGGSEFLEPGAARCPPGGVRPRGMRACPAVPFWKNFSKNSRFEEMSAENNAPGARRLVVNRYFSSRRGRFSTSARTATARRRPGFSPSQRTRVRNIFFRPCGCRLTERTYIITIVAYFCTLKILLVAKIRENPPAGRVGKCGNIHKNTRREGPGFRGAEWVRQTSAGMGSAGASPCRFPAGGKAAVNRAPKTPAAEDCTAD